MVVKVGQSVASKTPMLFLHAGWTRDYKGAADDLPVGKFGYLEEGGTGGEARNFKVVGGRCRGFSPVGNTLDIERLGAPANASSIQGVLVMWTATEPSGNGRFIVGWYENATVYAKRQHMKIGRFNQPYFVDAKASSCRCLAVDDRTFFVPNHIKNWPGINAAWYASEAMSKVNVDKLVAYVNGEPSDGFIAVNTATVKKTSSGKDYDTDTDPVMRKKVEIAATNAVTAHYVAKGFTVESVEGKNCGWDLNVTKGKRLLRVEVKGRGGVGSVDITHNEYEKMKALKTRMSYRLAIVHKAMLKSRSLQIFSYVPVKPFGVWMSQTGRTLLLKDLIGARASFKTD